MFVPGVFRLPWHVVLSAASGLREAQLCDRIKASLGPCPWPASSYWSPADEGGRRGVRRGVSQGWLHSSTPGPSTHQRPPRSLRCGSLTWKLLPLPSPAGLEVGPESLSPALAPLLCFLPFITIPWAALSSRYPPYLVGCALCFCWTRGTPLPGD